MMKAILFASDLDQTLMYSHRSLKSTRSKGPLKPVECLENQFISFMTQGALALLKELSDQVLFVPVTTRTKLQYLRLNFGEYGICPRYAVTSNGGTIFEDGQEDSDWKKRVLAGRVHCAEAEDLFGMFRKISHPSWVIKDPGKLADDLFYYCVIDRDKMPLNELADFGCWAGKNRWDLSIQGRKLYLVPRHVSKNSAIQYLQEKQGVCDVVAAGDSLLDLEMLKNADVALAPAHGELFAQHKQGILEANTIQFTRSSGIEAAEEILGVVKDILLNRIVVSC